MKKLTLLLLTVLFTGFMLGIHAQDQDTIRSLVISEWRGAPFFDNYIEFTNMGTDTLDLSRFSFYFVRGKDGKFAEVDGELRFTGGFNYALGSHRMSGTLAPGKSWLAMNVSDMLDTEGLPWHSVDLIERADLLIHVQNSPWGWSDRAIPEWEVWGKDSIDMDRRIVLSGWGTQANVLYCHLGNGDSVLVDAVNLNLDAGLKMINAPASVAGVTDATTTHTLVRKANVLHGNMDWNTAKGVDITDSEWLPIPSTTGWLSYTTAGVHDTFDISLESTEITIDIANEKLTVPWGIYKGDPLIRLMTLGPGMAWQYVSSPSFIDSTHSILQSGDSLTIWATGLTLEEINFGITVSDPDTDQAKVFSMQYKADNVPITDAWGYNATVVDGYWMSHYYVTDGQPGMDTIGNVLYATRVDTLYKNLEKAPAAQWEIIWKEGTARVDLQNGDILKVTAEDGTTVKEYFIDVQEYAASDNALLAALTWPDKTLFLEGWTGDTVPLFDPAKTYYNVLLPEGTVSIPAFTAIPQDINAKVTENRAVSLTGSLADRSTIFTVTSERGTPSMEYTITFGLEKDPSKIQVFNGTPFISEIATLQRSTMGWLEIVNPGNAALDLSEYLIVRSTKVNPSDALHNIVPAIATDENFKDRYNSYVPGYKFHEDTADWILNPGILSQDFAVEPLLGPGEVFVLATTAVNRLQYITEEQLAIIDKLWADELDVLGINENVVPPRLPKGANAVYIFKIENDSVLEGTKPVGDPDDYELVDELGDVSEDAIWAIAGVDVTTNYKGRIRPKSYIYTGARSPEESIDRFGINKDTSDWIVETLNVDFPNNQDAIPAFIGSHVMDVVTVYMSTVSSPIYLVSDGFSSTPPQTIQGDMASITLADFYGNIQKADTGQSFTMISGTDGSILDLADPVGGNDTLVVISVDSSNVTRYLVVDQPLDDNALLVVKSAYTGSYTVSVDGAEGTITGSGVRWGVPVKEILAALIVPDLATFAVIDKDDDLVALQVRNFDEVLSDVRINDSIFIEVRAQNGYTVLYQIKPESASSDAFVVSSVFLVDQDNLAISLIPIGISADEFKRNVQAVTGATVKVLDKFGMERTLGLMNYDDKLEVVSQDGTNTVVYYLNFLNEAMPDNNLAPTISVDITSANVVIGESLTLKATADDDGMPLPTSLTVTWEVISGEGVTIANPDALETDVTFDQTGAVVLQVTVSDGEMSRTDIVNVGVSTPDNVAPTVSVTTASFTTTEGVAINVGATADDDGNPIGSSLVYEWTVKTGEAANVTIASADQLDSEVTISTEGVYTLQITVTDGELIATDIVVVVVTSTVNTEPLPEPGLLLYPNPASDKLILELENIGHVNSIVKIYSVTGQAVFNGEFTQTKLQIDVNRFDAGLYFITVHADGNTFTKRIQVLK